MLLIVLRLTTMLYHGAQLLGTVIPGSTPYSWRFSLTISGRNGSTACLSHTSMTLIRDRTIYLSEQPQAILRKGINAPNRHTGPDEFLERSFLEETLRNVALVLPLGIG